MAPVRITAAVAPSGSGVQLVGAHATSAWHSKPSGKLPPNPAELLGSERFQRVLASLSEHFDVVLVDTPPILAVADAAVVARLTGVNLLVLKAGQHPLREIAEG